MKIGLFDSGIGGLALLGYARQCIKNADFVFYADIDNVPYGTKSKDEIIKLSENAVEFLLGEGCQAIVIACNTATSASASYLREKYSIPIIGIEPAVKPATKLDNDKRILVLATPFTVKEKKLHDLIDKVDDKQRVDMLATPKLVEFAEKFDFDSQEVYAYLENLLSDYDIFDYCAVVMGCTHFIHFKKVVSDIFENRVNVVDGGRGTINNLKRVVSELNSVDDAKNLDSSTKFFISSRLVTDNNVVDKFERIIAHALEINP